jgi:putative tricarboxylic transport membrane protein
MTLFDKEKTTIGRKPMLRKLCSVSALAGAALLAACPAWAEWKPTKPVDLVVHCGPGCGGDVFGRAIINAIEQEKLLPVRIQVSNRIGGGGETAMTYLSEKKGDPHTLGIFTMLWLTNPLVMKESKISAKDLTPIARMISEPALLVVRAESPYKTLKDFIEDAKKRPGQLKQSGGSVTSRDAIMRQVLMSNTDANWSFIPFPSAGERIAALLGGHVDILQVEPQEAGEQIRAGKLRIVAQLTDERLDAYPDAPTIKEAGFDVPVVPQGRGVVGPPEMPQEAVDYYVDLLQKVSKSKVWQDFVKKNQMEVAFLGPKETTAFFDSFVSDVSRLLKEAGVELAR